jgi:signal transduction histidine kinase
MAMRPLDRLPSIRAKLGAVIVFAVAVTIFIMYIALGFTLRKFERDQQFSEELGKAQGVAALGFSDLGRPSTPFLRAISQLPEHVVVVDAQGDLLVARKLSVPSTIGKALGGHVDRGRLDGREYIGVPVIRAGSVVGAVYLAYHVEGGGFGGSVLETIAFVGRQWKQFLVAGVSAAFIALLIARFLARGMTQPLRDMAQASSRMSRGDYRKRVAVKSRDEVGQLAEAFNRMAAEMEGLERLRRDLVANVSHELKTPISAIRARLENLLDGVEEPNPAVLSVMLQQSERLSRLVDQLLDLSRLESGDVPLELEPVDLAPLVDRVVDEVAAARPDRTLAVREEIPLDLPPVMADRERLHQVLFNLLDNAFRFTPSGGEVVVRAVRENGSCEVQVEDTGPGIPGEQLGLVFERFYRVDTSRSREDGGTGIGLAIARSVVEAHGGRIWAESSEGHGATFRFMLPLAGPLRPNGSKTKTEPRAPARA